MGTKISERKEEAAGEAVHSIPNVWGLFWGLRCLSKWLSNSPIMSVCVRQKETEKTTESETTESVLIGWQRCSHLVCDESQFAELLITPTAEAKLGDREQLSAHLHITQPTRRRRERSTKDKQRKRNKERRKKDSNENVGREWKVRIRTKSER